MFYIVIQFAKGGPVLRGELGHEAGIQKTGSSCGFNFNRYILGFTLVPARETGIMLAYVYFVSCAYISQVLALLTLIFSSDNSYVFVGGEDRAGSNAIS